jgi:hypothetical protein
LGPLLLLLLLRLRLRRFGGNRGRLGRRRLLPLLLLALRSTRKA